MAIHCCWLVKFFGFSNWKINRQKIEPWKGVGRHRCRWNCSQIENKSNQQQTIDWLIDLNGMENIHGCSSCRMSFPVHALCLVSIECVCALTRSHSTASGPWCNLWRWARIFCSVRCFLISEHIACFIPHHTVFLYHSIVVFKVMRSEWVDFSLLLLFSCCDCRCWCFKLLLLLRLRVFSYVQTSIIGRAVEQSNPCGTFIFPSDFSDLCIKREICFICHFRFMCAVLVATAAATATKWTNKTNKEKKNSA